MKGSDKFLIAIVVGVAVLLVAAYALVVAQPEPTYLAEDTPEGIVHNYLLALHEENYERAYAYLSPELPSRPRSESAFEDAMRDRANRRDGYDLVVISTEIDDDEAVVSVRETYYSEGDLLGGNQYSDNFEVTLQLVNAEWKIIDIDSYRYFLYCWSQSGGCN